MNGGSGRSVWDQLGGVGRLIGGAVLEGKVGELIVKAASGEHAPVIAGTCYACQGCGEVVEVDEATRRPKIVACPNGCRVKEPSR